MIERLQEMECLRLTLRTRVREFKKNLSGSAVDLKRASEREGGGGGGGGGEKKKNGQLL